MYLLVKLRIKAPETSLPAPVQDAKTAKRNEEMDDKFLNTRGDAEALEGNGTEYAHAPYWPGVRLNACIVERFTDHAYSSASPDGGSCLRMINPTGLLCHR